MNREADDIRVITLRLRDEELRYCADDAVYFTETYCKIEDRDSPGLIVPFKLWPAQKDALRAFCSHRLCAVLKARQLGLSWLALARCAHLMLTRPGSTVAALSRTEVEAAELTRRMGVILGGMPELLRREAAARPGDYTFKSVGGGWEITSPDGLKSSFRSFSSSPNAVRSFTVSLLLIDEWAFQQHARELWVSAFPAINRPEGGQVIGISTFAAGTLFEDIFTGDSGFFKIFLPWNADPRRTPKWYESTRRQLGELTLCEYPASVEEALSRPGGAFFPELREHIHLREPEIPDPSCRRYVALDYGLDMLAAVWVYVDEHGMSRVYRELCRPGLIVSEAASELLRANGGEKIHRFFAPPDLWSRNRDTGKSTADIFRENGVALTRVSNDREQGWLRLKEHLLPRKFTDAHTGEEYTSAALTFDRGACPETWRCLRSIQKDSGDPRDAAREPHSLTHAPDALRYFAAGRPRPAHASDVDAFPRDDAFTVHPKSRAVSPTEKYMHAGWGR